MKGPLLPLSACRLSGGAAVRTHEFGRLFAGEGPAGAGILYDYHEGAWVRYCYRGSCDN